MEGSEIDTKGRAHESSVNKTPILGRCQVITITRSVYHNSVNIIELSDTADGGLFVIILHRFQSSMLENPDRAIFNDITNKHVWSGRADASPEITWLGAVWC